MTSPFRTGSTIRWEIYINGTPDMDKVREACTDLIEGIDQAKDDIFHGEDGLDHTSIYVEPASVGEAVRRINTLGYSTDEDESEEEELVEGVDYPVDDWNEEA